MTAHQRCLPHRSARPKAQSRAVCVLGGGSPLCVLSTNAINKTNVLHNFIFDVLHIIPRAIRPMPALHYTIYIVHTLFARDFAALDSYSFNYLTLTHGYHKLGCVNGGLYRFEIILTLSRRSATVMSWIISSETECLFHQSRN